MPGRQRAAAAGGPVLTRGLGSAGSGAQCRPCRPIAAGASANEGCRSSRTGSLAPTGAHPASYSRAPRPRGVRPWPSAPHSSSSPRSSTLVRPDPTVSSVPFGALLGPQPAHGRQTDAIADAVQYGMASGCRNSCAAVRLERRRDGRGSCARIIATRCLWDEHCGAVGQAIEATPEKLQLSIARRGDRSRCVQRRVVAAARNLLNAGQLCHPIDTWQPSTAVDSLCIAQNTVQLRATARAFEV